MPLNGNQREAWNRRLVDALRSKAGEAQRENHATWFAWEKAAESVEAIRKDIWVDANGSAKNLPKEGKAFGKRARDFCEGLMRGSIAAPSSAPIYAAQPVEHPYLRSMTFQGGGYAILRALWDAEHTPGYPGWMTIKEICQKGQKYCNDPMENNHFMNRTDHGYGWESNKSLLSYKLIDRVSHRRMTDAGFRSSKDQIMLTDAGRQFIPKMLEKFGGEARNHFDSMPGLARSHYSFGGAAASEPFGQSVITAPEAPSKLSEEDEKELRAWVAVAAPGEEKVFRVSSARRMHLHRVIDSEFPQQTKKISVGDGRFRRLVVTKASRKVFQIGASVKIIGLQAKVDLNGVVGRVIREDQVTGRWIVDLRTHGEKAIRPENLIANSGDRFIAGDKVKIFDLKKQPQLNGKLATVLREIPESGRWQLNLGEGRELAVRAENLAACSDAPQTSIAKPLMPEERGAPTAGSSSQVAYVGSEGDSDSDGDSGGGAVAAPAASVVAPVNQRFKSLKRGTSNMMIALPSESESEISPDKFDEQIRHVKLQSLTDEVGRLQVQLDAIPQSSSDELLEVLRSLRALGDLPTPILKDTGVGRTIAKLGKAVAVAESVRISAKSLVDEWRQVWKQGQKRKPEEDTVSGSSPASKCAATHASSGSADRPTPASAVGAPMSREAQVLNAIAVLADAGEASTAIGALDTVEAITLVVDVHERTKDRTPRDIYESTKQRLQGWADVEFRNLKLGDYVWLRHERMLGACIERKTVSDLVGRSAKGDHLRQLRRLRTSTVPWPTLLFEGDEEIADTSKAVAYGAASLSDNPLDTALRSSCNVVCFLADVVLHSRTFLVVSSGPQDTVEALWAWTHALQYCSASSRHHFEVENLQSVRNKCDEVHSTLIEVVRAAGISGSDLDAITRRFDSVEMLQSAWASCVDERRRGLLLCPFLLAAAGDNDQARAAAVSKKLYHCAANGAPQDSGSFEVAHCRLRIEASLAMCQLLAPHAARDRDVELREAPLAARAHGIEAVMFQRAAESLLSQPVRILIVGGCTILSLFQQAMNAHSSQRVHHAELVSASQRVAHALLELCTSFKHCSRRLLLLESVHTAANKVCKQGAGGNGWRVASQMPGLLQMLVAVLAIEHGLVAIPRPNRDKSLQLLLALGRGVLDNDLLTQ